MTAETRAALQAALADAEAVAEQLRRALDALDADDPEGEADFDPSDLIDTASAAERADVPEDTIRYWLRQDSALGCKAGGRWLVSSKALSRRIRTRRAW